jgi:hypothetical protein
MWYGDVYRKINILEVPIEISIIYFGLRIIIYT